MHVTSSREGRFRVQDFAQLLRAAPRLWELFCSRAVPNLVSLGKCSASNFEDLLSVDKRITSGLTLEGVALLCASQHRLDQPAMAGTLSMMQLLSGLPCLPMFLACSLRSEDAGSNVSLPNVGRIFPAAFSQSFFF